MIESPIAREASPHQPTVASTLVAGALCLFVISALELTRIGPLLLLGDPVQGFGVLLRTLGLGAFVSAPLVACLATQTRLRESSRVAASSVGVLVPVGLLYALLWFEPAVASFLPLVALYVAFGAFMGVVFAVEATATGSERWLSWGRHMLVLLALAVYLVDTQVEQGLRRSFHLSVHGIVFMLGVTSLRGRAWVLRAGKRASSTAVMAGWLGLMMLALPTQLESFANARALHSQSVVGQAARLLEAEPGADPGPPLEMPTMEAQSAWEAFHAHSGMPKLDPEWSVGQRNVLLITIEALRYDRTSLANPEADLTPNLARLAKAPDSYWFADAHAPAAATLQSMASLLTARYPSAIELSIGPNDWRGGLREEARTLPMALSESGHRCFWIGHNYDDHFNRSIIGLERGFEFVRLVLTEQGRDEVDASLAALAIEELEGQRDAKQPFFGWVFFASPHVEYVAHYPDMAAQSELDRYEQEVRYADEQLGKVLDALERTGLDDDTVVIITGDHGEEFGEHGGERHGQHTHTEARAVPMVVHLPGHAGGGRIDAPVSTLYVFPWLFEGQGGPAAEFVTRAVTDVLAPVLVATEGAVISEFLGLQNMRSALVYDSHTFIYDFLTGHAAAYDRVRDRGELHDIVLSGDAPGEQVEWGLEQVERYRGRRRVHHAFDLERNEVHSKGRDISRIGQ